MIKRLLKSKKNFCKVSKYTENYKLNNDEIQDILKRPKRKLKKLVFNDITDPSFEITIDEKLNEI